MRCTGKPLPFSRRGFFRVRAMSKPVPRTTPHLDLRQNRSAWIIRMVQDRARRTKERTDGKKKEAERRQTRVYLLALRQARTLQGALACRRSTAVLPLGLTHPKVRRRTRFRGAGAIDGGGLPPAPTPVTASTSHAGHSAGGHDVRYRPSATGTNPLLAGTASRSRQPESPADVLARGARGWRFYSYRAPSQAESLWDSIYLNSLVFRIGSAMRCRAFRPELNKKSANLW